MGYRLRYGTEVEGRFKGRVTIILPSSRLHKPVVIENALKLHGIIVKPTHVWLECEADERFDWKDVNTLLQEYHVTVQIREPHDVPPLALLRHTRFSVVWMVPAAYAEVLKAAEYIKWATAPGHGFEAYLQKRTFDPVDYEEDEEWPL